jgi:hypothetical protein
MFTDKFSDTLVNKITVLLLGEGADFRIMKPGIGLSFDFLSV